MKKLFLLFLCIISINNLEASIATTIGEDIISPVTNSEAQKALIIGTSATLVVSLFKTSFVRSVQRDIHNKNLLCCKLTTPGNDYLQFLPNVIYTLAYGLDFYTHDNLDSKRRAIAMAKASLYSGLIADIIKPIVNEKRPNGGSHSFPSGHSTTAFAFASFVAAEHPWYAGVSAYMLASYVGYCRIQDNYHYLHDVMAGATIGISYGIAMSLKSKEEVEKKSAFIVTPTEDLNGLAFKYALLF